jgi:hypothetical protein
LFNRNAAGKPAAKAFVKRLEERPVDRDKSISIKAFRPQLKTIQVIYPDSGHGGIFQYHEEFAPVAAEFLAD